MERSPNAPHSGTGIALPLAAVLAAIVLFQVGTSFAKLLFAYVGPEGTTALRLFFAALLLLIVLRPWRNLPEKPAWASLAVLGVALAAMNFLYYMALARLPQGVVVAIEFTGPLAVAIFASRRAIDFLWVLIAIAGLSQLVPLHGIDANADPLGILYAFGAGIGWAVYILAGRRAGASFGTAVSGLAATIAAVLFVPVALYDIGPGLFAPALIPLAIAAAAVSSAIPYTLELYAMPRIPSRTFGVLMSIEPAVGALSGFLLWGERLTMPQWFAVVAVIVASAGAVMTGRGEVAPQPE